MRLVATAESRHTGVLVLLCVASVGYSLFLARSFGFNNVDDAYIAFRYARNLALGLGLVFNPGERVEGYTSPLWTVLMAPATRLPIDIVWFSIGGGLAASVAALWGLWAHLKLQIRQGADPWILTALAWTAADNSYAFWAVGGMETPLFTALIVWGTYLALAGERASHHAACGLVLGLATLARPEGALVMAVVLVHRFALQGLGGARGAATMLLCWAFPVVPHLLWRHAYYGLWLPNTFHNKVSLGASSFATGSAYAASFLRWRYLTPLASLLALADLKAVRRTSLPLMVTVAYLLYVTAVGGDWPPANRFFVPVIPFLAVLCVQGVTWAVKARAPRAAVLALLVGLTACASHRNAESHGLVEFNDNVGVETQRKRFGRWLRASVAPDTLIAVGPAGAIPYYSELPVIDMWGLTDSHIARVPKSGFRPGHDRTDLDYVVSRKPRMIVGMVGFSLGSVPTGYRFMSQAIPAESRPREPVFLRVVGEQ